MKKFALLAAGIISLGLGALCACTPEEEPPVTHNHVDADGDGICDDCNEPINEGGETPDFSEQLGDFDDMLWVSTAGVLDLANGTFEGASSFKITGVTGEKEETVISCEVDGAACTLSLNADGALEMKNQGGSVINKFMLDSSVFGGAWYEEGTTSTYYVISSTLDEDGYFSWKAYNQTGVTSGGTNRAVSSFYFSDEGVAGMDFVVIDDEDKFVASYFVYGSSVYMNSGDEGATSTAMTPYIGTAFSSQYINAEGETLEINSDGDTVTYKGESCTAGAGFSLLGGGIYFEYDSEQYLLSRMNEATYLITQTGEKQVFAPYNEEWLTGSEAGEEQWSNGIGSISASFKGEESITFSGTEYALTRGVDGGEVVYTFVVGGNTVTIRPADRNIFDVLLIQSNVQRYNGYYFRDSVKSEYFSTFTGNSEDLTIKDNYFVDITSYSVGEDGDIESSVQSVAYEFTYLDSLGSIACTYAPFGAAGATLYFTLVHSDGIYWSLAGSADGGYAVYSTYFSQQYLSTAVEDVTQSLSSDSDIFTTGGMQPDTIAFAFGAEGDEYRAVYVNGEKFVYTWGYGYIDGTEPSLYVVIDGEQVTTSTGYTYDRYTLFPSADGLSAVFNTVNYDSNTGMAETSEDVESFYIPASIFDEICGTTFVYAGKFVTATLAIGEDGALNISQYNADSGEDSLLVVQPCDYTLVRSGNVITFTYKVGEEQKTLTVTGGQFAATDTLVYSLPEISAVIGTYIGADDAYITLSDEGKITVDGRAATSVRLQITADGVTATYTLRSASYTALFNGTSVTVTGNGSTVQYASRAAFTPEKFVGTYTAGKNVITVYSSVNELNQRVALVTTINGAIASNTLTIKDGAQVLAFSARDFETFEQINCTLTLSGDSIEVNVNGASAQATASGWSYSDFVFEGEKTLSAGTLTCTVKEGAPVFALEDADGAVTLAGACTVKVDGGVSTLTLKFGEVEVALTCAADGSVSAVVAQ